MPMVSDGVISGQWQVGVFVSYGAFNCTYSWKFISVVAPTAGNLFSWVLLLRALLVPVTFRLPIIPVV